MKRFIRKAPLAILPLFLLCLSAYTAGAEEKKVLRYSSQWPFHPTKAVALDTARQLVFLGDGERICILGYDFNIQSNIAVSPNANIGGIHYDQANQRVFAASRSDGLFVIDVSDAQNPMVLNPGGFVPTKTDEKGNVITSEVSGVCVENGIAYIAGGLSGVQIINVSNPASPAILSWIKQPGALSGFIYAIDTVVSGEYLYIGDLINGVYIYSIADPEKPELIKIVTLPNARDLRVSGNRLFVATEGNGLQVIDITNPEDPEDGGVYKTDWRERSTAIDGNSVYVGYDASGIHMIDITGMTDEIEPTHNPAWKYTDTGAKSMALNAETVEKTMFITDDVVGLSKIDVTDPAAMSRVQSFDTPADATAVTISNGYAYVLDNTVGSNPEAEGLRIFEMEPFQNTPTLLFNLTGFVATPGSAKDVFVRDNLAYVADGAAGLLIVDISDKANPVIAGSMDTPGIATGIWVTGDYAYIADGDQGIAVLDIENPGSPTLDSQVPTSGPAIDIVGTGGYLYAALSGSGLAIYDISAPAIPQLEGSIDTPGDAQGIAIDGNRVIVADGDEGIAIINTANKSNPGMIANFDTNGHAHKVSISGNYAYVADGENGVRAVDLTDPAIPVGVSEWSFNSTGNTTDIISGYTVNDNLFVIAADGPAGVIALNPTFEEDFTPGGENDGGGSGCFIGAMRTD